jgi:hypothetical protein
MVKPILGRIPSLQHPGIPLAAVRHSLVVMAAAPSLRVTGPNCSTSQPLPLLVRASRQRQHLFQGIINTVVVDTSHLIVVSQGQWAARLRLPQAPHYLGTYSDTKHVAHIDLVYTHT